MSSVSSSNNACQLSAPDYNCALCPRLVAYREDSRRKFPDKFNGPVPSFGPLDAALLIVGLAPGLKGANFTGRPFTGDWAGDTLYAALDRFGFSQGAYAADPDDGLTLTDCRITNAVRCVPPENKPVGAEMNRCRPFLEREIAAMSNLKVILALGKIAHDNVLKTLGHKLSAYPFGHANKHNLEGITLIDSYHCSRYNTNTGRLTEEMFHDIFRLIRQNLPGCRKV